MRRLFYVMTIMLTALVAVSALQSQVASANCDGCFGGPPPANTPTTTAAPTTTVPKVTTTTVAPPTTTAPKATTTTVAPPTTTVKVIEPVIPATTAKPAVTIVEPTPSTGAPVEAQSANEPICVQAAPVVPAPANGGFNPLLAAVLGALGMGAVAAAVRRGRNRRAGDEVEVADEATENNP